MAYKYQKLVAELATMADKMPAETQFPSLRNIMERFQVSQATVDRAMDELRARRVIVSIEGEGFFVGAKKGVRREGGKLKVCFALNDYPSSFFQLVEETLKRHFEKAGHELNVVRYPWTRSLASSLRPGLMDALLALPASQSLSPKEAAFLKSLDIPAVSMRMLPRDCGVDCVGTDFELCGMIAADYLLKSGRKRLALLLAEPHGDSIMRQVDGFFRQARLSGAPEPKLVDAKTKSGDFSMGRAYEAMLAELSSGKPDYDAIFCVSDGCAIAALRACYERKVSVPGDLAVLGINGVPEGAFSIPSLTTFAQDLEACAEAALQIIQTRLAEPSGGEPLAKAFPPKLIKRESA